ncbi:hypothetical protein UFOVP529_87 [uncultured Caudovirales phage]|uniref:Uncharacterized protein n=1 Tax=uncultured Caudovirales phage TaxID=2100421 RepID=A0A6J5RJ98_9CAUD|nr:hypothetical protein UFOVP529_87 [uncultured Caudovirales phage]CAB4189973.1 hypothetical protein UFOVP1191_25 [uncultured Caudovirales phage]CAB4194386.1 hypothetical protein UFOVP1252_34 [uncultured Caudovirales phage]
MSDPVVDISKLLVDEELLTLEETMWATQRIWLIERSTAGVWGVAVVRDKPESEWGEPNPYGVIEDSSKWETIGYRRDPNLAKAIRDVRIDIEIRNAKEVEKDEELDSEAQDRFLQSIKPEIL